MLVSEEQASADSLATAAIMSDDPHAVLVEFSSVVADTQEYIIRVRPFIDGWGGLFSKMDLLPTSHCRKCVSNISILFAEFTECFNLTWHSFRHQHRQGAAVNAVNRILICVFLTEIRCIITFTNDAVSMYGRFCSSRVLSLLPRPQERRRRRGRARR